MTEEQIIEYYCAKIVKMVNDNREQKNKLDFVREKGKKIGWDNLSQDEKDIWFHTYVFSKAEFNRNRLELQKCLLDYEKKSLL